MVSSEAIRQPARGVTYTCPHNGEVRRCGSCQRPAPHLRVEYVRFGDLVPDCVTHGVKLVRSEA